MNGSVGEVCPLVGAGGGWNGPGGYTAEYTENKTTARMLAISFARPDASVAGAGDVEFLFPSPCWSEYAISPMSTSGADSSVIRTEDMM